MTKEPRLYFYKERIIDLPDGPVEVYDIHSPNRHVIALAYSILSAIKIVDSLNETKIGG